MAVAVFRKHALQFFRYPIEAVGFVVFLYAIFLLIFFGARTIGGPEVQTGDTLSAIVVGYVVFMITMQAYQGASNSISQESTQGTLEQMALNPSGLVAVVGAEVVAAAVLSTMQISAVIVPIMATTGRWLTFDAVSVTVVVPLLLAGVLGLGLGVGGLTLVFKRVGMAAGFLSFFLAFLVAAPVDRFPILKLLPIGHANMILRDALVHGRGVLTTPGELGLLVAVSAAYLGVGITAFGFMDRLARNRALLGQY